MKHEYDAVVIGSGPNGLAAAITLQSAGISVLIVEAKDTIGGGLRTKEITLPGFKHDICSAIHPLAIGSPFFQRLPLHKYGLEYIHPSFVAAHPFDGGAAALISQSFENTAASLGTDKSAYYGVLHRIVQDWPLLAADILGPLSFPKHPLAFVNFGLKGVQPATMLSKQFRTQEGKGLLAGMAAHSIQPLSNVATSAIALVLMASAHTKGWPIPRGGSQAIADALAGYFKFLGGTIETNIEIKNLQQLPQAKAFIFDITPKQLLAIAGEKFTPLYKWQLKRYRYGMGVFKVDWALSESIPFSSPECRQAGTVHLGNSFEEIELSERISSGGKVADRPFVLLAQQSIFDPTRAPAGKHTAWAYCHVPHGSVADMTDAIERQVERFAPGFRDIILSKSTMNTMQVENYNANYVGGDINGGVIDISQLYTRPVVSFSPYNTSAPGMYICSSSTPPGGGVHGMCGYHAAKKALRDVFHLEEKIGLARG